MGCVLIGQGVRFDCSRSRRARQPTARREARLLSAHRSPAGSSYCPACASPVGRSPHHATSSSKRYYRRGREARTPSAYRRRRPSKVPRPEPPERIETETSGAAKTCCSLVDAVPAAATSTAARNAWSSSPSSRLDGRAARDLNIVFRTNRHQRLHYGLGPRLDGTARAVGPRHRSPRPKALHPLAVAAGLDAVRWAAKVRVEHPSHVVWPSPPLRARRDCWSAIR